MQLSEDQKKALEEQKANCPFCRILKGEIPAHKVYEDELVFALLDINPLTRGHLLLLPKEHIPVLPMASADLFSHLAKIVPEIVIHLKKAVLASHCTVFVASGAPAGQQSAHLMIHIIPSDAPLPEFALPAQKQDEKPYQELLRVVSHNLPLMLRERITVAGGSLQSEPTSQPPSPPSGAQSGSLAELIASNPDFKKLLMQKPEAVLEGIKDNPSLQPLFEGVDIFALSESLRLQESSPSSPVESSATQASSPSPPSSFQEQVSRQPPSLEDISSSPQAPSVDAIPRAIDLSDEQLRAYLEEKPKLKELLDSDLPRLKEAILQQEKLRVFFSGTTPEEVNERT